MKLNFKDTEEQKIYVSSDFHLKHDPKWENPIWKMRGFNSAVEMTDGIIKSVNDIVRPNDVLLFLGDLCLNTLPNQFDELISRFQCQNIYMLHGNHPNPHFKNIYVPMVKKLLGDNYVENSEVYPLRYKNIVYVGDYVEAILNGQMCILCHYPIYIWNHMAHNSYHLCGHSHGGCPFSVPDNFDNKILDVGWDLHKKPLSLPEIAVIMQTKQFKANDGHHTPEIQS